jgi:hypothetical protein
VCTQKYAHLHSQGKEQSEPIEVDNPENTEANKCEDGLTELQTLIIEVASLKASANLSVVERKRQKQEQASSKTAQNAAAKAAFVEISEETYKVCLPATAAVWSA